MCLVFTGKVTLGCLKGSWFFSSSLQTGCLFLNKYKMNFNAKQNLLWCLPRTVQFNGISVMKKVV